MQPFPLGICVGESSDAGYPFERRSVTKTALHHAESVTPKIYISPGDFFAAVFFEVTFSARYSAIQPTFQKLMNNKKGGHVIGAGGSPMNRHGSSC